MTTLGRITATCLLLIAGFVAQRIGCWLIRIPHEPFNFAEVGGLVAAGIGWALFGQIARVWSKRSDLPAEPRSTP